MCGNQDITGSILENMFVVDPIKGIIWHNPNKDRRGQKRKRAGVAKRREDGTRNYRILSIRLNGTLRILRAHHLVWCWVHGEWPKGELDHINGKRDDNRIINLRPATISQNRCNKTISRNNKSGYKWVHWCTQARAWLAEVNYRENGISKRHKSRHTTAIAAYKKACEVASLRHGAFYNPGN